MADPLEDETPDTRELVHAIGWVTVAGSHLERSLRYLFVVLMDHPESLAPELLSSGQPFMWLHDNCLALAKNLREFKSEKFTAGDEALVKDELATARRVWNQERNFVVHGTWHLPDSSAERLRFRELEPELRVMSRDEVSVVARHLLTSAVRLMRLGDDLGARFKPASQE